MSTVRFLHGTTTAALALARARGELRPRDPRELCQELEAEFGLVPGSVWSSPYFEFSRSSRADDPHIYLTQNRRTAESYANCGSESVADALRAVWRLLHPDDERYPYDDRLRHPHFHFFRNEWCERHDHLPVVLTFDVPVDAVERSSDWVHYRDDTWGRREKLTLRAWLDILQPANTMRFPFSLPLGWLAAHEQLARAGALAA